MNIEKIDLYNYFGVERADKAVGNLICYTHGQFTEFCNGRKRPLMIVLPGGAYRYRSDRENEPIAMKFFAEGYNVFVLEYSVAPTSYPAQLLEAVMAVAYARKNADKYFIDKDHIGAIGFSAGGHLCSMLATISDEKEIVDILGEDAKLGKPNAVILSYPVISLLENTHGESANNLSGGDSALKTRLSTNLRVEKNSVPAFIWTTVDDQAVPSENSLEMACAYKKAGVPFELHVYETGVHGLSLATKETSTLDADFRLVSEKVATWFNLSIAWLKSRGFDIYHS